MKTRKLLGLMDAIAQCLITSYITDFTVHDTSAILNSKAQKPFIWRVYDRGTSLYFSDEAGWGRALLAHLQTCKLEDGKSVFFIYDGKAFYPAFPKTVMDLATEQMMKTKYERV
jgi:hypothetical protein